MSKHTPGPWRATDMGGELGWVVQSNLPCINGLSAWVTVANVGAPHESDQMFGGRDHEADARLMAAAPELLEALQALLKRVKVGYDGLPQGHGVRITEAAIAKATGIPSPGAAPE